MKHTEEFKRKLRERNLGNKYNLGKHNSPEQKLKISIANSGSKNGMWKGDECCNTALHWWVRNHLPKKEFCEYCNKVPPYDLANVTGNYNRDFKNWKRLCRRCHMLSDNRMQNLKQFQFKKGVINNGR